MTNQFISLDPKLRSRIMQPIEPVVENRIIEMYRRQLPQAVPAVPAPAPAAVPTPAPVPVPVPPAVGVTPFGGLPNPSPGEPIRAEDFRKFSQALTIIFDVYTLSSALFGHTYGEARLALNSQQYQVRRVMTVFGTELSNTADTGLDGRKVVQVSPVILGERSVDIVLSEAVETRKFAPNLVGLTYQEAVEKMNTYLGEVAVAGPAVRVPDLVNKSLQEASQALTGQI